MSSQNKILIGFAAIVAFAIGFAVNQARISDEVDTSALLTAQLIVSEPTEYIAEDETSIQEISTNTSLESIKGSLGKLTLINFWATWCAPCREEMPLFELMYRKANPNGFVVIGIALDTPDKAQPMLDSMDITYPIFYAEETGNDIMGSVGNPQGLLPYSLILDENGKLLEQFLGQIDEHQISHWLTEYL